MEVLFSRCPPLVLTDHGHHPSLLSDKQSYPVHPRCAPVDDGLYFRRPPLVLAEQGSYCPYPPPGLLGHDFHARHPPIGLSGQGLHPHAPECQGVFHQLPPCARGQGFITSRSEKFREKTAAASRRQPHDFQN